MSLAIPVPRCTADEVVELSPETLLLFGRLERAVKDLDGFLSAIDFQKSAMIGTNYFAVSVGGIDAIRDLEEGRGVDPETLAALYAGFAIPSVSEHLNLKKNVGADGRVNLTIEAADGRLRYKGAAVRLYAPDRLRELFERREAFRAERDRKRTIAFSEYVFERQLDAGSVKRTSDGSVVQELSERFRKLQPLISDFDAAIRAEASSTSIMPGSGQHFFAYSLGGIDVLRDLSEKHAVDPETLAAIYASKISPDYDEAFQFSKDGRMLYNGDEIKLYSREYLEECFKRRERLTQKSQRP